MTAGFFEQLSARHTPRRARLHLRKTERRLNMPTNNDDDEIPFGDFTLEAVDDLRGATAYIAGYDPDPECPFCEGCGYTPERNERGEVNGWGRCNCTNISIYAFVRRDLGLSMAQAMQYVDDKLAELQRAGLSKDDAMSRIYQLHNPFAEPNN